MGAWREASELHLRLGFSGCRAVRMQTPRLADVHVVKWDVQWVTVHPSSTRFRLWVPILASPISSLWGPAFGF